MPPAATIGYPQSSSSMSSGSSSAHIPKPSHAMRSTTSSVRAGPGPAGRSGRAVGRGRNVAVISCHLFAIARRRDRSDPFPRAGPPALVDLPLAAEDPEGAEELPDGAIGMATGAPSGELLRPALDPLEVVAFR